MKLYPRNEEARLSSELFREPEAVYRGAPFWAWNTKLEEQMVRTQVRMFQDMGMGGFHSHVRTGLDTPYLSEEFFQMMDAALDEAKKCGLKHWLYDEDRWPSGAGGGIVTENPQFAQKELLFTTKPIENAVPFHEGIALEHDVFYEMARYQITLDQGLLVSYQQVAADMPADRYAYLVLAPRQAWWNDQSYVDTLKKDAIEAFMHLTHDAYAARYQEDFGATIPAIFTDEPQFSKKGRLPDSLSDADVRIPFTDDLEESFQKAYGMSLLAHLPELFWERADGQASVARYRYHDHVCERFAEAFADTVGAWCQEHGLLLTGHMMEEPTLGSQTAMLGEAMRSYRGFGLPGIDMLCDRREYTTAKQAQSASHQMGCPGVTSELYGVTNWDFDFRGHVLQGDWQAALGVTTRVHHLTWMRMAGEAKRDYPASIGYQSPWYKKYKQVEDHFARVNTALTRGTPHVRIGVVHPIESFWLSYGPNDRTGALQQEMEDHFVDLNQWLLLDGLDFDYISEGLLKSLHYEAKKDPARVAIGQMEYDVLLLPDLKTIRSSTLEMLKQFLAAGGTVLVLGSLPTLVDAEASVLPEQVLSGCQVLPFARTRILQALEPWREIEVRWQKGPQAGMHTTHLLHQYRTDGDSRWLFLVHGKPMADADQPQEEEILVKIKGRWKVTLYDTWTGEICPLTAAHQGEKTSLQVRMHAHDSLLLHLEPWEGQDGAGETLCLHPEPTQCKELTVPDAVPVTLEEPNVLLLDRAEWWYDDAPVQPTEEILRIDKALRTCFGYPLRMTKDYQPYQMHQAETPEHWVHLRYTIEAEIRASGLSLALENRKISQVLLDGQPLASMEPTGYYVDEAIETIAFPDLAPGTHSLEIRLPFGEKTDLEDCYLLGDFGVRVQGTHCVLTEPVRMLYFGDWCNQGLPFYGGNVVYHIPLDVPEEGLLHVRETKFRAPAWTVNGGSEIRGALAPYETVVPSEAGRQDLDVTVYGNRINTFGQVHNCDESMTWFGAASWRTEGAAWSDAYCLHRMGWLKRPEVHLE